MWRFPSSYWTIALREETRTVVSSSLRFIINCLQAPRPEIQFALHYIVNAKYQHILSAKRLAENSMSVYLSVASSLSSYRPSKWLVSYGHQCIDFFPCPIRLQYHLVIRNNECSIWPALFRIITYQGTHGGEQINEEMLKITKCLATSNLGNHRCRENRRGARRRAGRQRRLSDQARVQATEKSRLPPTLYDRLNKLNLSPYVVNLR